MNPALRLLMRLQCRASIRRMARTMRKPKGATFAIIGVLVCVMWLGPAMFTANVVRRSDPATVRLIAPLVMLLMCGLTLIGGSGDRAISFTPGEVNFLFPGPFTRRELLLFKLARTLLGVLFSGLILSVVLLQHATNWPAAFVGSLLAMALVQLLTLAVALGAQSVSARAFSTGRRVALGLALAALIVVLAPTVRKAFDGGIGGFGDVTAALERSRIAKIALPPFAPFSRAFTAESPSELLLWGGLATAIDLMLLMLVIRLDADYREAALAASQKMFERMQRVRRGQTLTPFAPRPGALRRRSKLPMFPWFGGAGPTAWRQATTALRTSRGILLLLLLMSFTVIPLLFAARKQSEPVLIAAVWVTVFLTMVVKFDFRTELDQMDWLKALPLGPIATAAGQLATPVLLLTLIQSLIVGSAAWIAAPGQRPMLLVGLPFLLPFNLLLMSIENLLFLLFPSRQAGAAPGDVGQMGRAIVFFLLKMLVLGLSGGLAAAVGVAAAFVAGNSTVVGISAAFAALLGIAIAAVPLVGSAYRRFDPSMDAPA